MQSFYFQKVKNKKPGLKKTGLFRKINPKQNIVKKDGMKSSFLFYTLKTNIGQKV